MKNLIQPFILLLIAFLSNYDSFSQEITFPREFQIKLDTIDPTSYNFFIPPDSVKIKAARFKNNFRHNNDSIKLSHHFIPMTEIRRLYLKADSAANRYFSTQQKYVTGIELHYTVLNKKCILLFRLWYLDSASIEGNNIRGKISSLSPVYLFHNSSSQFRTVPLSHVQANIQDFLEKIRVRKNGRFVNYDSSDTRSALFSFQELFFLYHLNYKDSIDSRYQYFKHIVSIEGASFGSNPKLTSMFNCEECVIENKEVPRPGYGANLAHLCPPSCGGAHISYPARD